MWNKLLAHWSILEFLRRRSRRRKSDSSWGEILVFETNTKFALRTGTHSIFTAMPSHCRTAAYSLPSTWTVESGVFAMQKSFRNLSGWVTCEFSAAVTFRYTSKPVMQNSRSQCISGLKPDQKWPPVYISRWKVQNSTTDRTKLQLLIRHCVLCRLQRHPKFKFTLHLDMASCWLVFSYPRSDVLPLTLQNIQRKCNRTTK